MGRVYLVRHGQASFGADDYDQLSPLGERQCQLLGAFWRQQGVKPGAVLRGSLRRHAQSWVALQRGYALALPEAEVRPALNEYDSEALIATVHAQPLVRVSSATQAREHFRLLRQALQQWMAGDVAPRGMPTFQTFRDNLQQVLADAHALARAQDVLIVSSGGPLSVALAQVMGAPTATAIALNMRMRNSAVSELVSTARGLEVVTLNTLPHLQGEPDTETHA